MPKTSEWTELLGEVFLDQFDAVCEEIKGAVGWPPLGMAELSPSGARHRKKQDADILADLFGRVGPEKSVAILKGSGVELLDEFGEDVVAEAIRKARRAFAIERGDDGREVYVEPGGRDGP